MANEINIKIKSINDMILFEHSSENNTIRKTVEKAILSGANQRGAYLRGADLRDADLSGAYLRDADLSDADLSGAYLSGAYLSGADLRDADLSGADLSGAYLRDATYGDGIFIGDTVIQILGLKYPIFIFQNHIKIGCKIHTKDEWRNFSDKEIADMSSNSLVDWKKYKDIILSF